MFFFELRNVSAEAGDSVGIEEDFKPGIKIQYMFSVGKGYITYPRNLAKERI